jgi:hypothetical protein
VAAHQTQHRNQENDMSNKLRINTVNEVEDATLFTPWWQLTFNNWVQLCDRLEHSIGVADDLRYIKKYLAALKGLRALFNDAPYEADKLLALDARVGRAILEINIAERERREREQEEAEAA